MKVLNSVAHITSTTLLSPLIQREEAIQPSVISDEALNNARQKRRDNYSIYIRGMMTIRATLDVKDRSCGTARISSSLVVIFK